MQAPLEEPRAPLRQRLLRWASEVLESDFIRTSRIAPRPAVRLLHDGDQGKPRWSVWQLLHAPPYSHRCGWSSWVSGLAWHSEVER